MDCGVVDAVRNHRFMPGWLPDKCVTQCRRGTYRPPWYPALKFEALAGSLGRSPRAPQPNTATRSGTDQSTRCRMSSPGTQQLSNI